MADDAVRRVRSAIERVLDQYGATHHAEQGNRITFSLNGAQKTIRYSGGDPRAHLNAATQIKRMLHQIGAVPVETGGTAGSMVSGAEQESEEMSVGDPWQPKSIVEETRPDVEIEPALRPTDERLNDDEPAAPFATHAGADYVVLSSTKYKAGEEVKLANTKFIAIVLDHDLVAPTGTVLVVPLGLKNVVWDMPGIEFQCLFAPAAADEVQHEEPATIPTRIIAPAPQPPEDEEPAAEPAQYPQPQARRRAVDAAEEQAEDPPRVSPQLGRVMIAMNHLHSAIGRAVAIGEIGQLLPRDAKSVPAMLTSALKLHYAVRISTPGVGSRYMLTETGRQLAAAIRTWPFDVRDLPVPPWLTLNEGRTARR